MIKRIVVTLDGSPVSEGALPKAIELAKGQNAPIHLLRVVDVSKLEQLGGLGMGLEYSALDLALQDERTAARDYLEAKSAEIAKQGITVTTEQREGIAARAIVEALQPDDMLVIASPARTGSQKGFWGRVAEEVVRRSPAPVLLVHPEDAK
ncbi:MAG: universal stress protein [Chloroflexota bacterium]